MTCLGRGDDQNIGISCDNLQKRIKKKYERILSESQVPLIPLEQVHIKRKLVSGPFSGVVCEAEWLKPDGTKASDKNLLKALMI